MNRFAELVLYNGGCLPGTPGKRLAFTANLFAKMSEFQTGSLVRFFLSQLCSISQIAVKGSLVLSETK